MDDTQWRTHRLELDDQTLREWDAQVLAAGPEGIVLDRSAFYPGGGGQPPDHGVLLWGGVQTQIVGARKGDDLYLIPAEGDPLPVWARRCGVPWRTSRGPGRWALTPACPFCSAVCSGTSAPW